MKKLILSLLCCTVLMSTVAGAATRQYSRSLTPFSGVEVSGPFSVSLVRGSDYRSLLSVEEAYIDYVICEVRGSTLYIGLEERKVPSEIKRLFRGKGTPDPVFSAVVYVPDLLQSVTMSDKSVLVDTEDLFDKSRVTFTLSGSSTIKSLKVSSLSFNLSAQNKSVADFDVTCRECKVQMANSAQLHIVEQESEESEYKLAGTSKTVSLCTSGLLSVYTKGNCTMTVTGSGTKAQFDINGTSEVDASGFEVPDAVVKMSSVCKLTEAAYKTLRVNLNGGSTLHFINDPAVTIENIRSATMSPAFSGRKTQSL
ncbi:MAG: DUF2807 domain-containing protein [Bacteroidales bacterium]|nr:DUF2807 domain-containing protein [Bacteroidales bacterium]